MPILVFNRLYLYVKMWRIETLELEKYIGTRNEGNNILVYRCHREIQTTRFTHSNIKMIISRIEFCVDELSTSNISRVQILEKRGRRRSVGFYEYKGLTRFDISKSLKITHEGPGINGTFITDDKSLTELI